MAAGNRGETQTRATRFGSIRPIGRDIYQTHGRSFQFGIYYPGRGHYHWTHYTWWSGFGCYVYWCPCAGCYYRAGQAAYCYYPVSYAETVARPPAQLLGDRANNNLNLATANAPATALRLPPNRHPGHQGQTLPRRPSDRNRQRSVRMKR